MITNHKVFEAGQRRFAGGNLFSNNHRIPNLPKNCPMIDIDNLGLENDEISAIIEDKYKFESVNFGNPLLEDTWQKRNLVKICDKINCELIFLETSTNRAFILKNDVFTKRDISDVNIINTSDRLYIEIRWGRAKAVMFRTENLRKEELQNDILYNLCKDLANDLSVNLFLINDVMPDNKIYIKKDNSTLFSIINDPNSEIDWQDSYKNLDLLN